MARWTGCWNGKAASNGRWPNATWPKAAWCSTIQKLAAEGALQMPLLDATDLAEITRIEDLTWGSRKNAHCPGRFPAKDGSSRSRRSAVCITAMNVLQRDDRQLYARRTGRLDSLRPSAMRAASAVRRTRFSASATLSSRRSNGSRCVSAGFTTVKTCSSVTDRMMAPADRISSRKRLGAIGNFPRRCLRSTSQMLATDTTHGELTISSRDELESPGLAVSHQSAT